MAKKKSSREKRTYSIVLEVQVHERLVAAADENRRTISGFLNYLLDKNLPQVPKVRKPFYGDFPEDDKETLHDEGLV